MATFDTFGGTVPAATPQNTAGFYQPTNTAPAPPVSSTINSNTLTPSPTLNYSTPSYPSAPAMPDLPTLQATPMETQANDLSTRIQAINDQLSGKAAYTLQQQQAAGIPDLNNTLTDLQTQLTTLNKQAASDTALANNQVGLRNISSGDVQRISNQRSAQANLISANIDSANGLLASANQKVQLAVNAQFAPLEAELKAKTDNLDLILKSPEYTLEDKNRAQQQQQVLNQQAAQLDLAKQNYLSAQTEAIKYAGVAPANVLQEMQSASSPAQVAQIAAKYGIQQPSSGRYVVKSSSGTDPNTGMPYQIDRVFDSYTGQWVDGAPTGAGAQTYATQLNSQQPSGATQTGASYTINPQGQITQNGQPANNQDFKNGVPITSSGAASSPNINDSTAYSLATGLASPQQYLSARSTAGRAIVKRANQISQALYGKPFDAAGAQAAYDIRTSSKYQNFVTSAPNAVRAIGEVMTNLKTLSDAGYLTGVTSLNSPQIQALANGYEFWAPDNIKQAAANILSQLSQSQDDIGQLLGTGQGSDFKIKLSGDIFSPTGGLNTTQSVAQNVTKNITSKLQDFYSAAGVSDSSPYVQAEMQRLNPSLTVINGATNNPSPSVQEGQTHVYNGVTYKVQNGQWVPQ